MKYAMKTEKDLKVETDLNAYNFYGHKISGKVYAGGTVATAQVVPVAAVLCTYSTGATAVAATLANGETGQIMIIKTPTVVSNLVLTPANLGDGTTITFDASNERAIMMFDGTNWQVLYTNATVA